MRPLTLVVDTKYVGRFIKTMCDLRRTHFVTISGPKSFDVESSMDKNLYFKVTLCRHE